jgi:hypothetical protein
MLQAADGDPGYPCSLRQFLLGEGGLFAQGCQRWHLYTSRPARHAAVNSSHVIAHTITRLCFDNELMCTSYVALSLQSCISLVAFCSASPSR